MIQIIQSRHDSAAKRFLLDLERRHRSPLPSGDPTEPEFRRHVSKMLLAMHGLLPDEFANFVRWRYLAAAAAVAFEAGPEVGEHAPAYARRVKLLVSIASSVLTSQVAGLTVPSVPLTTLHALAAVAARATDDLGRDDVAALLASADPQARRVGLHALGACPGNGWGNGPGGVSGVAEGLGGWFNGCPRMGGRVQMGGSE